MVINKEEWEAWLENPITLEVISLILEKSNDYTDERRDLDPRTFDDAHSYYGRSLELTAKAESYLAIHDSFDPEAFDSIFEVEDEG